MPASLITRLPADRRTEILRKISQNSKRLRGYIAPNLGFDATKRGRVDSLQAVVRCGIIPIQATQVPPVVTLHCAVDAEPANRGGTETVTVTSGAYNKVFAPGANADDAILAATGTVDFTATDSADANATGAARTTIT